MVVSASARIARRRSSDRMPSMIVELFYAVQIGALIGVALVAAGFVIVAVFMIVAFIVDLL
jgi:hypothetical protein